MLLAVRISSYRDLGSLESNQEARVTLLSRLFTIAYFSVIRLSLTGRHLGPLMRAKLGRVQNARGWGWPQPVFVLFLV